MSTCCWGLGRRRSSTAAAGYGPSTEQILAGISAVRSEFGESIRVCRHPPDPDHARPRRSRRGAARLESTDAARRVAIHELDCRMLTAHHERSVLGRRKLTHFLRQAGRGGLKTRRFDPRLRRDRPEIAPHPRSISSRGRSHVGRVADPSHPGPFAGATCASSSATSCSAAIMCFPTRSLSSGRRASIPTRAWATTSTRW